MNLNFNRIFKKNIFYVAKVLIFLMMFFCCNIFAMNESSDCIFINAAFDTTSDLTYYCFPGAITALYKNGNCRDWSCAEAKSSSNENIKLKFCRRNWLGQLFVPICLEEWKEFSFVISRCKVPCCKCDLTSNSTSTSKTLLLQDFLIDLDDEYVIFCSFFISSGNNKFRFDLSGANEKVYFTNEITKEEKVFNLKKGKFFTLIQAVMLGVSMCLEEITL